jgi:hypothetical protein
VSDTPTSPTASSASIEDTAVSSSAHSADARVTSSSTSFTGELPSRVTLDVPFAPQAPFANWDAQHEETCEEMSLIMVEHFWKKSSLSLDQAESELQDMVSSMSQKGLGYDVTIEELAGVAEDRGFKTTVKTEVTEQTLKEELARGNPVIIPAAGRLLGNPYFSGEGPWYHMLVVTGYKEGMFGTTFITNDPGTKRGKGFEYKSQTLLNAIHDWTGVKEEIATGRKAMLVVTM